MERIMQCGRCGRKLKDNKSVDRGYGLTCWKKEQEEQDEEDLKLELLFVDQVNEEEDKLHQPKNEIADVSFEEAMKEFNKGNEVIFYSKRNSPIFITPGYCFGEMELDDIPLGEFISGKFRIKDEL